MIRAAGVRTIGVHLRDLLRAEEFCCDVRNVEVDLRVEEPWSIEGW